MAQTTTKAPLRQQNMPPPQNAVAVLAPPRLMPPENSVLQAYDVDNQGWRTLVESIFPAAKTQTSVMMALDYCKRRKLDVFKHPVHIVPIWNSQAGENGKGAMVETIWPGINELRTTAIRTGQYAGMDVPTFGPMIRQHFKGKIKKWANGGSSWEEVSADVTFPEWCQITVYRTLGPNRVPFPGPRVYWMETYARIRNDCEVPNSMWEKRANGQLEKCAEAAALRRAFPEELGSDYSIDEIGAFSTHTPMDVTDEGTVTTAPPAEPKREDYVVAQQTSPPAGDTRTQGGKDGQPEQSSSGGGSDSKPEAAATPAPTGKEPFDEKAAAAAARIEQFESAGVTDVVDENEVKPEPPKDGVENDPKRPLPGEKLEFARFAKVAEFCEFADSFLPDTNAEGARQFEAMYDGTLIAMERGKKGSQEAAAEIRAILKKMIAAPREPGEEG